MIDKNNPQYHRRPRKAEKKDCAGCEDNFYNGHNPFNIEECWHFPTATLIARKEVSSDQKPPWTQAPTLLPTCYHRKGFVYIGEKG